MTRLVALMPAGIGLCLGALALDGFGAGLPVLGWAAGACALVEFGTAALLWRFGAGPRQLQKRGPEAKAGGREGGRVHGAIIGAPRALVERNGGFGFRPGELA